jgi:hypothetical protein
MPYINRENDDHDYEDKYRDYIPSVYSRLNKHISIIIDDETLHFFSWQGTNKEFLKIMKEFRD